MMRNTNVLRILIIALMACSGGVLLRDARADVTGSYANGTTYTLTITHMPDFDQRRKEGSGLVGLPGDGKAHCVPTSTMNLFAYAANHGFPGVMPGPAWWQSQLKYNDAGNAIAILGTFMGTSPTNGTNGNGQSFGAGIWLVQTNLTRSTFLSSGSYCPTINSIAQSVALGGIASLCYGRYTYFTTLAGTDFVGPRTGGHCITLSKAQRSGSSIIIKVRDPADDPDYDEFDDSYLYSQSMFADRVFNNAKQRTVSNFGWTRTMTALVYPPNPPSDPRDPTLIALVDSYQVIRPKSGYSWQPGINNDPPKFNFNFPPMGGSNADPHFSIDFTSLFQVDDVRLSADLINLYVIGRTKAGAPTLQLVELPTGASTEITQVDGAKAMTVGRKGEIYVLTDNAVVCINPFNPTDPVEAQVFPPGPCNAICYDDAMDEVVLLSPDQGKIFRYKDHFPAGAGPQATCIPAGVALEPDAGAISMSPAEGKVWFVTPASNMIYHVPFDPDCNPVVEKISMDMITNPRSISFDDMGHMFVACDAGLVELMQNAAGNGWQVVPNGYFPNDTSVGPKFYVTRSRTNYDPDEHGGPEWYNVDPDEIRVMEGSTIEIDCLADIVSSDTFQPPPDGKVDGADLAYLLGAWGANDGSLADIVTSATFTPPEDGIVDGADLAFLLGAWGDCP